MTKYITQVKNPADANDPYIIKDPNAEITVGQMVGKMYRSNVGGSGSFSISGNTGIIPNLTAGTYTVHIYAKSATPSYTFRFNFGTSVTYDLSATDGILSDTRTITISAGTFSGSVIAPSGGVASGTHLYVVMYTASSIIPIKGVGAAAVTNSYTDLNDKPTIPAAANNGTLYTSAGTNGTEYSSFTANQSGNSRIQFLNGTNTSTTVSKSGTITSVTINSTDTKVKQTLNSDAGGGAYPLLLTGTSSPTSGNADEATYVSDIRYESDFHGLQIGDYNMSQPAANTSTSLLTSSAYIQATSDANADQTMTVIGDFLGTGESSIMVTGGTTTTAITRDSIDTITVSADSVITATATVSSLAGTGNRMVVANADGTLSTDAIPTNTDEKVTDAAGTGKAYLLGHTTQATNATAISNANVYMQNGRLTTSNLSITSLGTSTPKMLVVGTSGTVSSQAIPSDSLQQINGGKKMMVITGVDSDNWTAGDAMTGQASSDLTYNFDNKILSTPAMQLTNVQSGTPITSGYLALDSGNNVIKTGIASQIYYIDALTVSSDYIPLTVNTTAYTNALTALNNGYSVVLRWAGADYEYEYAYLYGYNSVTAGAYLTFISTAPRMNSQKRTFIWTYTINQNNANIVHNKWTSYSLLNHPTSTLTLSGTKYVTMKFDYDTDMTTGHNEYDYETFVYSSGTVGSISITNINANNLGTQKYFKIINNSNSSINVPISGTNLKGGGTFTVNAQSLVEFSCIVTYGTSNSTYWGVLTHSDNISI